MRPVPRPWPAMLIGAALLHFASASAAATTLYVKTSGNDLASCAADDPCRTISHAVSVAAPGDTIQVGVGTFSENNGITINKDITVIGTGWLGTRVQLTASAFTASCCAVFTIGSDATVTLSLMSVTGGKSQVAGGIFNEGTLHVDRVLVFNNVATGEGGAGIYNQGTLLTMSNVAVTHNNGHFGLLNRRSVAVIDDSRITDTYGWGQYSDGIGNAGGSLYIQRGLIAGNQGTGLVMWDPLPYQGTDGCPSGSLRNVTISNNGSKGVETRAVGACAGYELVLRHATITANKATAGTGGLYVEWMIVRLQNTILAGNDGPQCGFNLSSAADVDLAYSLVGDTSCKSYAPNSLLGVDPMLEPLKYGVNDPIAKVFLLGATKLHMLKPGSPAIDRASLALCSAIDQLGILRPIDGDGDGNAGCDIGAHEYRPKLLHAER